MSKPTFLQKVLDGLKAKGINLTDAVKMAAHALSNGESVYTEAEAPAVGDGIYSDESMSAPLEDGTYELESGVAIIVTGGQIAEIVEPPTEAAEMEAVVEQLAEQVVAQKAIADSAVAEVTALKAQIAKLTTEAEGLKVKLRAIKPNTTKTEESKAPERIILKTNNKYMQGEFDRAMTDLQSHKIN